MSSNKKVKFFHRHCTLLKTKIDLGIVAEDTNCLPSSHEPEEKQKFHYLFCLDHNTFRFTRGKLLLFHFTYSKNMKKKLFAYSCGMYFQIRKKFLAFIHGTIISILAPYALNSHRYISDSTKNSIISVLIIF